LRFFPAELAQHYRDISFVAEGGFARVYRAIAEDGRTVAIRVPKVMDQDMGRLYLNEANIWSQLDHRNIVKLYNYNIVPFPYLELEWIEGGSLDQVPKPLSLSDAAAMVLGISEGLRHAHSKRIVHRDLKPGNVLLTAENEPKITDWGISQPSGVADAAGVTSRYTLLYAAPEQIEPAIGTPNEKTDVYQLGSVFYELVTGTVPFRGRTESEILTGILYQNPEPPSMLNPEAKPFEDMILGCLEKRQADRLSLDTVRAAILDYLGENYRRLFTDTRTSGNRRREQILGCELVMLSARQNNLKETLAYMQDLKEYARNLGLLSTLEDVEEVIKLYASMKDNSPGLQLDEEIVERLDRLVQRIKMT